MPHEEVLKMSPKLSQRTTYEPSEDIWLMLEEYRKTTKTEGFKDVLEALLRSQKAEIEGLGQLVKDLQAQLSEKALTDLAIPEPSKPSNASSPSASSSLLMTWPLKEEFYCSHTKQHFPNPKKPADLLALPCMENAELHCKDEVCGLIIQRFMRKLG